LKIQNKILFGIFKIKYYFENTILHITGVKAMCQVNGRGSFSALWGSVTP